MKVHKTILSDEVGLPPGFPVLVQESNGTVSVSVYTSEGFCLEQGLEKEVIVKIRKAVRQIYKMEVGASLSYYVHGLEHRFTFKKG